MRPARNLTLARATDLQLGQELVARGWLVSLRRPKEKPARKPIAKRNRKRAAKTYARNFGRRGAAVRAMPCCAAKSASAAASQIFHCDGPIEAAHVRARGMGGAKGDRRCLVPLCHKHHAVAGEARTSARAAFESCYGISLDAEANRIARDLDERGYP